MDEIARRTREESWLVLRAQAGDRQALEALVDRLLPPLRGYLRRLVPGPESDDVLQDCLVLVFRSLGALRDPELLRPWAYRIASREAFRRTSGLRNEAARRDGGDALDEVPVPAIEPVFLATLDRALARLPPRHRAVVALHYFEQMTFADVAAVLAVPVGTVKSRLAEALRRLRGDLGKEEP